MNNTPFSEYRSTNTEDNRLVLYDVVSLTETEFAIKNNRRSINHVLSEANPHNASTTSVYNNNISRSAEKSNKIFSLKDSEGNELSQAQQEYFADSKVRDEEGNLLVMYHGTPNAGFTVFKDGSYFTVEQYTIFGVSFNEINQTYQHIV